VLLTQTTNLVACVHIGAGLEKQFCHGHIAEACSSMQQRAQVLLGSAKKATGGWVGGGRQLR
jgi:hypothetical protein